MISETFDSDTVRRLAGPKVYGRGEAYARTGHVDIVESAPTLRIAEVIGTDTYRAELSDAGDPNWSCTCPYADDGAFCKHLVALSLVEAPTPTKQRAPTQKERGHADQGATEAEVLAEFILGLSMERLRQIVIDRLATDSALRLQLLLEATTRASAPLDRDAWRRRIIEATDSYGEYVGRRESSGWAEDVYEVLSALTDLVDAGYADDVIGLSEFAFQRIEGAVEYVDDSSSGALSDLSERAGELHFAACSASPPNPVALAGRLIELEVDSELEGFYGAVSTYADLLGRDGLLEYRHLVEARLAGGGDRSWTLQRSLEDVLEELGDRDELIALLEANGRPGDHIRIVEVLVADGCHDDAIERGQRFLSNGTGSDRLRDLVAALLRDRGDEAEARMLYVRAFQERPTVQAYEQLLQQPGVSADEWYGACIETTRTWLVEARTIEGANRSSRVQYRPSGDVLVEMLLLGERFDEAWDAGVEFGCREDLRLTIARAREATHPVEAIDLYEDRAFRLIATKDPKVYGAAIDLLDRIRLCCITLEDRSRFDASVHRARTEHKPKRNVQKLLDQRGW